MEAKLKKKAIFQSTTESVVNLPSLVFPDLDSKQSQVQNWSSGEHQEKPSKVKEKEGELSWSEWRKFPLLFFKKINTYFLQSPMPQCHIIMYGSCGGSSVAGGDWRSLQF